MYEIKVRMMNEAMARKLLEPLDLGAPHHVETATHTYLTDAHVTRKIKNEQGVFTYTIMQRHGAGFTSTAEEIPASRAEELEREYPRRVALNMTRTIWQVGEDTIALNVIDNVGVFLEFRGEDFEMLKNWPRKIGFSEQHYLTRTYDELA
ncbi:MAG: hypothetical protein AB1352_05390 [Patescibacteria group bacterium]